MLQKANAREDAESARATGHARRAAYMEQQAARITKALSEVGGARQRAESACEELRASLMRGSALMRVKLRSAHHAADHELDIAVIDGTPHAFTDSVLPRARSVYERAVANGQIDPLP
jgi:hypothetical protein